MVKVPLLMALLPPISDQNTRLVVPSGATSRKSRSSARLADNPVRVMLTVATGPVKPLTLTVCDVRKVPGEPVQLTGVLFVYVGMMLPLDHRRRSAPVANVVSVGRIWRRCSSVREPGPCHPSHGIFAHGAVETA
jgi:hypothetical protein